MKNKTAVIIGNGMVGNRFCEKIKLKLPDINVIVFSEEPVRAYDRVHLTDYFKIPSMEDLFLTENEWYTQNNIQLHLNDPVVAVDRSNKKVRSLTGITCNYDYLIFATGSAAFVPPIKGTEKEGVFLYRTIEDLDLIKTYAKRAKRGAVIGGGLLGLEAAKALVDLGMEETTVIEFAPRLMPRQIDDTASTVLQHKLNELGLTCLLQKSTNELVGNERLTGISFQDGSYLDSDILIISAGIRPRDELAKKIGLATGDRGGILVNAQMQTSDGSIYAIGECALFNDMIYGLVAPGYEMAEVAASHIAEEGKMFKGFDMSTKLKLMGVDVASFGDPFISEPYARTIVLEDRNKGIYKRLNISTDGTRLLGGILVGEATAYNMLLQTVNNNLPLPEHPEQLLFGEQTTGKKTATGLVALPDEALICSCEGITKAQICDAVATKNCENAESVKSCTRAGSGCGGCVPMVKDLIAHTMKLQGKYIRTTICEHFDFSRQELFDLIKIHGLRSYDQVLDQLGKGDGCEVCKPLVSSLLASCWNEMILRRGNDVAQDSNDRYLANIQRGGTYSVVPRIPGGEILPEKLIVIGEVAKKYGLYTKITGGQRIDLFGAHLNDLPAIWEELIAAGFESGHAYGKALRTVKSCVGSTWCRFGLHDSVSFAIRIEERYRGLRAPHKIKSAVSGCIRECAEAQSKDFGIIATEKGWNLYVCGNGGSKPQHALLLASDIDEETCIRYIDRFLMFYIHTADPLTRTATWLNKMDGGIDYLKNVIVNDSLGMAENWEQEMQGLVDAYQCEWKVAVNDPDIRKRFVHFVNAPDEKDSNIRFDELRGQKKAADWNTPSLI
ncbi:assimilatory nitrite reductase (NAD(P)H) large subunit precursor [Sphingobacterium allocomposti]|uniref:Assimilatory nitrite reductase (NAD(P)H) large subunit n=1 Tax=Sphingobacterium allocomposti TaxID=415956 RepID=A0A5S5DMZ2_9SPHI|nr:nitrite reductase large subunit NirB [Sphingobacterium composti Yoo et al. 2007 non Ten et al. 2007]TYP97287.1 assimilatory nitrite reductase (NAD(P)H) large subunit precursor [Sphingobacterium composti Yoo et al. 2007 non Ten et al. 2007]